MRRAFSLALIWIATGCAPQAQRSPNDIVVGALLPFTGSSAATGANIEQALFLVAEQVNAAGGIGGRNLRIEARDTQSDTTVGLTAYNQLADDGVQYIIGPQDGSLAEEMVSLLHGKQVLAISGGIGLPRFDSLVAGGFFIRIGPSVGDFANVMATRIAADGVKKIAVVSLADEYSAGFAVLVSQQFSAVFGGTVTATVTAQNKDELLGLMSGLAAGGPDAVVLALYPPDGAAFVQNWAATSGKVKWYLAPTLRTNLFVENTPPGILDGAIGCSPSVAADADAFTAMYRTRWSGESPTTEAFYAYDAMALLALSMESAWHSTGGNLKSSAVKDAVGPVSYLAGGQTVAWYELTRGLAELQHGVAIDYRGASGSVDVVNTVISQGLIRIWGIKNDQISDLELRPSTFCATFACQ